MQEEKPTAMRCPECGAQNRQDATFCSLCLTRFDSPAPAPSETAADQTEVADETRASAPTDASRTDLAEAGASPASDKEEADPLAELPPELQLELKRPQKDVDMRRVWLRGSIAVALSIVIIALSVGFLAFLANRQIGKSGSPQKTQQQPTPAPSPSPQVPPGPSGEQGTSQAHPDITFALPSGWSSSGTPDDLVLNSADASLTMEIRSWQRGPSGRYVFLNGEMRGTAESAALAEMGSQLVQYLYGSTPPPNASSSTVPVGKTSGVMAEARKLDDKTYRRAYGFVHGDFAYLVAGAAPLDRETELAGAMQSVLGSISFKT